MEDWKDLEEAKSPLQPQNPQETCSGTIFITGANGLTGSAAIDFLSSNYPNIKVFAGVRDLSKAKDKWPENVELSLVEGLPGNQAAMDSLVRSMTGSDAVMVVPPGDGRVEIAKMYIEAAKQAKVKFICLVSVASIGVKETLFATQFRDIETAVMATGIRHAFLRCELFMDNHLWDAPAVKKSRSFSLPVQPDAGYNPVASSDVGAMAATVMVEGLKLWHILPITPLHPQPQIYHLTTSKTTTMTEIAGVYSKIANADVKFVEAMRTDAMNSLLKKGMPEWQAIGTLELYDMVNEGLNNKVSSDIEKVLKRKALTIEEFLMANKEAFIKS